MQAVRRWLLLSSNQLADRTKAEAISAGTEPGLRVHPEVQTAMQEVGIDLSEAKPKNLTEDLAVSNPKQNSVTLVYCGPRNTY